MGARNPGVHGPGVIGVQGYLSTRVLGDLGIPGEIMPSPHHSKGHNFI